MWIGIVTAQIAVTRNLEERAAVTKSFVVVSFQNMKKAKSYSDSMKEFTAARLKTTKSRSFIVEGL